MGNYSPQTLPNVNTPNASDILSKSQGLYSQALGNYTPSAGLNDYVNSMMNQNFNKDYTMGLSGSSIEAQNQAHGIAQAYDKDQQQYLGDLYGTGKTVAGFGLDYDKLNEAINAANTSALNKQGAMSSMEPWEIAGGLFGSGMQGLASYFGANK